MFATSDGSDTQFAHSQTHTHTRTRYLNDAGSFRDFSFYRRRVISAINAPSLPFVTEPNSTDDGLIVYRNLPNLHRYFNYAVFVRPHSSRASPHRGYITVVFTTRLRLHRTGDDRGPIQRTSLDRQVCVGRRSKFSFPVTATAAATLHWFDPLQFSRE